MTLRYLLIIIGLLVSLSATYGQDRKVDLLKRLYAQENFKRIYKKSVKLQGKSKYTENKTVALYKMLSLNRLSKDKRYLHGHKNTKEALLAAIDDYKKLDPQFTSLASLKGEKSLISEFYAIDQVAVKKDIDVVTEVDVVKDENVIDVVTPTDSIGKIKTTISIDSVSTVVPMPHEDQIISYAETFIGVPYKYGGANEKGFDCSGFTGHVLETFGYSIPRSARDQQKAVEKIKISNAQKGDLVFFGKSKKSISHVGLVVSLKGEDLTMIHASSSRGIMISNIENDTYWKPKLRFAGRVIKRD